MIVRVFIEETTTRLLYHDVEAASVADANQQADAALESGDWADWTECDSNAALDVREEAAHQVTTDGGNTDRGAV